MKKTGIIILLVFIFTGSFAQQPKAFLTDINIIIYSPSFEKSKQKANAFVSENSSQILMIDEKEDRLICLFYMTEDKKEILYKLLPELGFVQEKEIKTTSYDVQITKDEHELEYLTMKKTSYTKELNSMEKKDERYYEYWRELREIEKLIFDLEQGMKSYENNKLYKVKLKIYDDEVDLTSSSVSWVNMPGASYDILFVENPNTALSSDLYMGYALKYMITKGKSYFSVGALKNSSIENPDSSMFTELFHFGFGQDFYTKHFGRGKRKWLNLYTGYNLGGVFATANNRKSTMPYLKAFFGLELFKNKYFLIDNRVGYFVPFKYNRNLRGLEYSVSFNFVF